MSSLDNRIRDRLMDDTANNSPNHVLDKAVQYNDTLRLVLDVMYEVEYDPTGKVIAERVRQAMADGLGIEGSA